ncbi:hypothetical protein V6C27_13700 [Peptococcaceae bacterium 1198_IL3148]
MPGIRVSDFSPEGKTFCFNFTKDTCDKIGHGICSVNLEGSNCNYKASILYSTLERFPITIIKYDCGHYEFSDGQHRTCIAGQLGLIIPIVLYKEKGVCSHCESQSNILVTF